jgi:hypothetical protein
MAVPTNTFKSYEAVGNKEDLSDMITNISPVDTLFFSKIGKCKDGADATKHEWQTDSLAAAASNAQLEGDETTPEASTATARLYNMMQIQKKSLIISGTQEKVKKAGRTSEVDYQTAKKMKELSKDIEYAFLRGVRADGAAGTARQMRGALNWTTTNLSMGTDGVLASDGTVSGGTARAFTETILQDVLSDIWAAGGDPDTIYCNAFQKQAISGWSDSGNYRTAVEGGKLDGVVDVYVSDFGTHTIKAHRQMPTDVVFVCDHEYWKKGTLRPTFKEALSKTGDNEKYQILVEHTLEASAEGASGRITDLTTA